MGLPQIKATLALLHDGKTEFQKLEACKDPELDCEGCSDDPSPRTAEAEPEPRLSPPLPRVDRGRFAGGQHLRRCHPPAAPQGSDAHRPSERLHRLYGESASAAQKPATSPCAPRSGWIRKSTSGCKTKSSRPAVKKTVPSGSGTRDTTPLA